MSKEEKLFQKKLGEIKDFWIGDNSDWQDKMTGVDGAFVSFIKVDIVMLLDALDHYSVGEQRLKDEIEFLRNKMKVEPKNGL